VGGGWKRAGTGTSPAAYPTTTAADLLAGKLGVWSFTFEEEIIHYPLGGARQTVIRNYGFYGYLASIREVDKGERAAVAALESPGHRHVMALIDLDRDLRNARDLSPGDFVLLYQPKNTGRRYHVTRAAWLLERRTS
jgi:hypothetical protein